MALKPCLGSVENPRCPAYAEPGKSRCAEHHREWERQRKASGATGRRGTTREWSKARLASLAAHHWRCVGCKRHISEIKAMGGKLHVHHINGDAKDHDLANLEPRCSLPGGGCHEAEHRAQRQGLST